MFRWRVLSQARQHSVNAVGDNDDVAISTAPLAARRRQTLEPEARAHGITNEKILIPLLESSERWRSPKEYSPTTSARSTLSECKPPTKRLVKEPWDLQGRYTRLCSLRLIYTRGNEASTASTHWTRPESYLIAIRQIYHECYKCSLVRIFHSTIFLRLVSPVKVIANL